MKAIEMAEATRALSHYARQVRRGPIVVVQRGRPVAALVPLDANDWEDFVVARHPGFLRVLERSDRRAKREPDIPFEAIQDRYARTAQMPRRRMRRPMAPAARRSTAK